MPMATDPSRSTCLPMLVLQCRLFAVAGIIAAAQDANLGVAGIAPKVKIMVLKVRGP